jgi:hypothetical protein
MKRIQPAILAVTALFWFGACSEDAGNLGDPLASRSSGGPVFETSTETFQRRAPAPPERNAYFGDLHVHTTYSFDAFAFGTIATPADAYRYARGEALLHPGGFEVQLREPLDFYAVTDHAMFLGVVKASADTTTEISKQPFAEPLHDLNAPGNDGTFDLLRRLQVFGTFIPGIIGALRGGELEEESVLEISRSAWRDSIDAADLYYEPGHFTTFAAYEYTSSSDDRGNLHRNVIFRSTDVLPDVPFSRFHSQNPEGLWDWMDALRESGVESLAIPHNSNGSNGQMFKLVDWAGDPLDDAYARRRIRNEPLVEITQVKGTSETHPSLSPNDEWADFEIMPYRVATMLPSDPPGSYVRDALLRGLELEGQGITNPYDFGIVAASDTHTGAISDDESNFFSKVGLLDATPDRRGSTPMPWLLGTAASLFASDLTEEIDGETYLKSATSTYGASGLAGVWAEENTREAIYDAFRRKETFATSGTRIRLRFFAGHGLDERLLEDPEALGDAYTSGVPMGGDLEAQADGTPQFVVWALADPKGSPLQRLQIIKGYLRDGESREQVYDVGCSEGEPDPETHRCADNGAAVDLTDCSTSPGSGAAQLSALWTDPDFEATESAFYYARVLENPVCRWSTWDALREEVERRSDLAATIQERAWSSPISLLPLPMALEDAAAPAAEAQP